MGEDEKMIVEEEEKYKKELEDFRRRIGDLVDGGKERELYERVTNSKTKNGSMGVTLTPRREGSRWSLKIDIPIDVLKKWMGEEKK